MKQHQQPNSIFQSVDPNGLKPHPSYSSIYGEAEDVSDLIALIQNKQYPRPLLVNQEKTIVNGHLYWKAALSLGWNSIPVEVREFSSQEAELEALLLENADRNKTNEQKVREAIAWERIEKAKAKQRQQLGAVATNQKLGRNIKETLGENFPHPSKGKTRDRVASLAGLGSGRNYSKAKKIVTKIDNLLQSGNIESASNLRKTLNEQSIDAATKLLKSTPLNSGVQEAKIQKPSCWNCKHCSREEVENNHSFYCYKFGLLSFLEKDGETRASLCPSWSYRLSEDANDTTTPNPSYFTLSLPSHLKPLIRDAARASGMTLADWVNHHILQAIELSFFSKKH
jgi:ParB-like chromosome segregation protein Spo0J